MKNANINHFEPKELTQSELNGQKLIVDTSINNPHGNTKHHIFNVDGYKFILYDYPEGFRVESNSTNYLYRWGFSTRCGYPILDKFLSIENEIRYYINNDTAKTHEQAIKLFKEIIILP